MKILFLSAWFPYPPNNGSKLRIYNLLSGLSQNHQVTLISFCDEMGPSISDELKRICEKIYGIPSRAYNPNSLRALTGFFNRKPRALVDRYDPAVHELISREIKLGKTDLIIASEWGMADYCQNAWRIPMVFEDLELGVYRDKIKDSSTSAQKLRHQLTWIKMKHYLRRRIPEFSLCTVVSTQECQLLRDVVPGYQPIAIIPNGVDLQKYVMVSVEPQPNTLIFTGSFTYGVNYDAMVWFLTEVYPLIKSQVPGVELTITGDHANLPLPESDGVKLTGMVADVKPLIAASSVSIVPILSGGGTRLKILEAMALRTPVVATSKGAEGLNVQHGEHLLIADQPGNFANAVITLLRDEDLRGRMVENAFKVIQDQYDWRVILPKFTDLVERCAVEHRNSIGKRG